MLLQIDLFFIYNYEFYYENDCVVMIISQFCTKKSVSCNDGMTFSSKEIITCSYNVILLFFKS